MLAESVGQCSMKILNTVSDDVFLKEDVIGRWCFIQHLKNDTEKVVLLEVKGLRQIIVKCRTEKTLYMFISPNILFREMKFQ